MFRLALATGTPDIREIERLPGTMIQEWRNYFRYEPFGDVMFMAAAQRRQIAAMFRGDTEIANYMPRNWIPPEADEGENEIDAEAAAAMYGAYFGVTGE